MTATVTELKKELDSAFDGNIDTKISVDQLKRIRDDLRMQYVMEFNSIKEAMEISVAMGDDERAQAQRTAAERVLKAISIIDSRLKDAEG